MNGPLRLGIVGFGRIGAEHAGWVGRSKNVRLVAVADPTAGRLERAAGLGVRTYGDFVNLIGDSEVDAVLVSTPTAMHYSQAEAALVAGKHVMIEKPMALDLAESEKLVELAKGSGRTLSVFHNRRWDADFLTVREAVRSGVFGKLINVESRLGQFSSCVGPAAKEYRPGWRNEASYGGGGLYDWGSHFVDQMWRLLYPARPVRVFAQMQGNVWTEDCDDFARVCIDFDSGVSAMVEINTTTSRPLPRWHLDGTEGSATAPHSPEFDVRTWAKLEFTPAAGGVTRMMQEAAGGLDEVGIWDRFAEAVWGRGEPAVSAISVLPTMRLLDAARESAREGRVVKIPGDEGWDAGSE